MTLIDRFHELQAEATRLAGGLRDLTQRATVYHHVFRHSGRNHVFPVIAAHGALWAKGYFEFGLRLGEMCAWQYAFSPARRREQLAALHAFADRIRDINRRVCIDTYTNYHFVGEFGEHPEAATVVAPELLAALNRVHAARRAGRELPDAEKRVVFEAHFLHEQTHVVGPTLERAAAEFPWPLVKWLALKPVVRFAFMPRSARLWFGNFTSRAERIRNGMRAFDVAAAVGWDHVEGTLRAYDLLPAEFFRGPQTYFQQMRAWQLGLAS